MQFSWECNDVPSLRLPTEAQQGSENWYHVFPYGAESPYVPRPAHETETRISGQVGHQKDLGHREDREYREEDREHQNCMQSLQDYNDAPLLIPVTDAEQGSENRHQTSPHKAESPLVPASAYETDARVSARVEHREDSEHQSRMQSSQGCSEVPSLKPATDAGQGNDNWHHVFPYGAEIPYVPRPAYETEARGFARVEHRGDQQHQSRMQSSQEHKDVSPSKPTAGAEQGNDNRYHVFPHGAESPYAPRPAYETGTREFAQIEHREDREHQSRMQSSRKCNGIPLLIPATDVEQNNENRYYDFPRRPESPHVPTPAYETETRVSGRVEHREDSEHQSCMQSSQEFSGTLSLKPAADAEQSSDNRYHVFPYGAESPYVPRPAYETETREFARVERRGDRQHQSRMQPSQEYKDVSSSKPATDAKQGNDNRYHASPHGAESSYIPHPAYETETRASARIEHQEDLEYREDRGYREDREHQNCMQSPQECNDVPLLKPP